jgi:hypothetical protein
LINIRARDQRQLWGYRAILQERAILQSEPDSLPGAWVCNLSPLVNLASARTVLTIGKLPTSGNIRVSLPFNKLLNSRNFKRSHCEMRVVQLSRHRTVRPAGTLIA